MWASLSLVALLVVKATAYNSISSENIGQGFREFLIVPQIIPEVPPYLLTIIFGPYRVYLGTTFALCDTTQEPLVSWPNPNDDILYTLVTFTTSTPGATLATNNNNLTITQLAFNIPGGNIEQGDKIVPFTPPNPLLGIGYRRYVWLVYRQVGRIEITAELYTRFAITYYSNFDINEFVDDFNLDLIAGNFLLSKRTLCDAVCCSTSGNSCGETCGPQGCLSSSRIGFNSFVTNYT